MKILKDIKDLKGYIKQEKILQKKIGFVPTMGYLHEGHLSLIKRAKAENDICIVSIFVNPTQFGPNEDFEKYPRDFEHDCSLLESANVDALFLPEPEQMYPNGFQTYIEVGELTQNLCGTSRPGHFKGVTTVVAKLLNLVSPDRAYFGQKDAQQLLVIEKMVADLNMDIAIIGCPIIREEDGLAMSSRNSYLTKDERKQATVLCKSLKAAKAAIDSGERSCESIDRLIREIIAESPIGKIDYVEIVSRDTLQPIKVLHGSALIALAVYFGKTRLIDNIFLEVD